MPIIQFDNYIIETTSADHEDIKEKIVNRNFDLLGDYVLEDHIDEMHRAGYHINLYKLHIELLPIKVD